MKRNKVVFYQKFLRCTQGILRKNPVLSLGLAIPFAVVVTTSLQSGVALSLAALVTYLPTMIVASLVGEKAPQWLRIPLYPVVASLFLLPARYLISRMFFAAADTIGAYMTMLCVSTMLLADVEEVVAFKSHKKTFLYGLRNWIGFTFAILLLSIIREMLGGGSVWSVPLNWVPIKLPGILVACGGWILLGFVAAFGKKIHRWLLMLLCRKKAAAKPQPDQAEEPLQEQ